MKAPAPQPPPLPGGLPVPPDDGAANHLHGLAAPAVTLRSTAGGSVDLAELAAAKLVLYVFPKMGPPHEADPSGWNDIPGARGCTQQSCSFRDQHEEFSRFNFSIAGVSAQAAEVQREAAERLHLSFPLLADPVRQLGEALNLPTFRVGNATFYRRLTLLFEAGRIIKVFFPVFPPDENPSEVLRWIRHAQEQ